MYDAIAFAGGGNRCYWQGGFWSVAAPALGLSPRLMVGVSAGAWTACYSLLGQGAAVNALVAEGCEGGVPNLDWRGWRKGGPLFPVAGMFRELMNAILSEDAFARLRAGPTDILVGVARTPRRLPLWLAIPVGIGGYQIEKKLVGPVHPRVGRMLGFKRDFVALSAMKDREELIGALMASASVPPFMPVGSVAGTAALDGGLVDNVPVEPLVPVEAAGGRTLVLLSRRYARLPDIPGRTYVQPSRSVAVGQFDITKPAAIRDAFALGWADGAEFVERTRRAA